MELSYRCSSCDDKYVVTLEDKKTPISSVPSPGTSILKMQYQDHGDHTYFLEVDPEKAEISRFQIIPHIRSVFETLLYDNIVVSRIVDTLLGTKNKEVPRVILYITDLTTFKSFFAELSKKYSKTSEEVSIHFEPGFMVIGRVRIILIICSVDIGLRILKRGHKANKYLKDMGQMEIRSLVIDTSIMGSHDIYNTVKKAKLDLSSDLRTILAFDTRKTKEPPLDLREYFLDKFSLSSLELLNYHDTNGLKSIFLQSYYNVMEDPYEVREIFELVHTQHKPSI